MRRFAFVGLGMAAGFAAALILFPAAHGANDSAYKQLDLFTDAFERVRANYVRPVQDSELVDAAIQGMVSSLDPHSSYMDAKAFARHADHHQGRVRRRRHRGDAMEDGLIKVISPIDGTPAARAGIKPGDRIAAIDGTSIPGLALNDAIDKMRGPAGTKITLTILREGEKKPFDVTLTRAIVQVDAATYRREGDIGYIRLPGFNEQTADGPGEGGARSEEADRPGHQGLCARPAQQSGRLARSGDPGVGRFPQFGRDRFHPRPSSRGHPAL